MVLTSFFFDFFWKKAREHSRKSSILIQEVGSVRKSAQYTILFKIYLAWFETRGGRGRDAEIECRYDEFESDSSSTNKVDSSSSVWWYGCKEGFSYRGRFSFSTIERARAVAHTKYNDNRNKMEFVVMCSRHFLRFRMQEQWQRLCFSVLLFRLDFSSLSLRLKNRRTRSGTRREMLNICNFIIIHSKKTIKNNIKSHNCEPNTVA